MTHRKLLLTAKRQLERRLDDLSHWRREGAASKQTLDRIGNGLFRRARDLDRVLGHFNSRVQPEESIEVISLDFTALP